MAATDVGHQSYRASRGLRPAACLIGLVAGHSYQSRLASSTRAVSAEVPRKHMAKQVPRRGKPTTWLSARSRHKALPRNRDGAIVMMASISEDKLENQRLLKGPQAFHRREARHIGEGRHVYATSPTFTGLDVGRLPYLRSRWYRSRFYWGPMPSDVTSF